jgi:predicted lysophospholipase L1 biosynthesis ABC-type transport system permease subunit
VVGLVGAGLQLVSAEVAWWVLGKREFKYRAWRVTTAGGAVFGLSRVLALQTRGPCHALITTRAAL